MPERVQLRDGTTVGVAGMRSSDGERLVRFHSTLSWDTTYLRFFSPHRELSAKEVELFTHVDHVGREAIVITSEGEIVAVGRFDRLADPTRAEVAFAVSDCWQGRGVGRLLFERLERRAHLLGVTHFVAETLSQNQKMLGLFHHVDHPVVSTMSGGVVHLEIDLIS
jgi:GNAT superfamily N-acetyltransferase